MKMVDTLEVSEKILGLRKGEPIKHKKIGAYRQCLLDKLYCMRDDLEAKRYQELEETIELATRVIKGRIDKLSDTQLKMIESNSKHIIALHNAEDTPAPLTTTVCNMQTNKYPTHTEYLIEDQDMILDKIFNHKWKEGGITFKVKRKGYSDVYRVPLTLEQLYPNNKKLLREYLERPKNERTKHLLTLRYPEVRELWRTKRRDV